MINRFKEMINAGVAPARYNNDFCDYSNNLYHVTNEIVRKYNCVWGALTDTNMRYNNVNDSYIITGSFVGTGKFDEMLDLTHFGTTFFITSFQLEGIKTLREFFNYFNLCGQRCSYNGSVAFILTNESNCQETLYNIINSYNFKDERIVPCGETTICSCSTFDKYNDYMTCHGNDVRQYLRSYCYGHSDGCEKACEIAKCLFPFCDCDPTPYKLYNVVSIEGIGSLACNGHCCTINAVDGSNIEFDFDDDNMIEKLYSGLSFLVSNQ